MIHYFIKYDSEKHIDFRYSELVQFIKDCIGKAYYYNNANKALNDILETNNLLEKDCKSEKINTK